MDKKKEKTIMKSIYVPALLTGIENPIKQIRRNPYNNTFGYYKDFHDPSWFSDRAIFIHPEVLVSFYYSGKIPNYRKTLGIRDDITLWADSGGYSIATQGGSINPVDVLKWQEKNSNKAFSLDIPPSASINTTRISPGKIVYHGLEQFEKNAIISRENNIIFRDHRTTDKLKIYNVIHGYNKETFELWWDYATRDIQFEGYATGLKPTNDPLLQAMCLMFLYSKGVRERVHLLGVSGIIVIPLIVWMSKYIDGISFDSTSYGYGSRTRAYMYPERIRYYTHFGEKFKVKDNPMNKIYCKCPICKDFETPEYFCKSGITWPGMLLSLHNLWVTKEYVAELEKALHIDKDEKKFRKLVVQHTGNWSDKTFHAINFIEHAMKFGFDKAYDLYLSEHDTTKKKFRHKSIL